MKCFVTISPALNNNYFYPEVSFPTDTHYLTQEDQNHVFWSKLLQVTKALDSIAIFTIFALHHPHQLLIFLQSSGIQITEYVYFILCDTKKKTSIVNNHILCLATRLHKLVKKLFLDMYGHLMINLNLRLDKKR